MYVSSNYTVVVVVSFLTARKETLDRAGPADNLESSWLMDMDRVVSK